MISNAKENSKCCKINTLESTYLLFSVNTFYEYLYEINYLPIELKNIDTDIGYLKYLY